MITIGINNISLVGGEISIDFINTVHRYDKEEEADELKDYKILLDWLLLSETINTDQYKKFKSAAKNNPEKAEHALKKAQEIRRALFKVLLSHAHKDKVDQKNLDILGEFWKEAHAHATFISKNEGGSWKFEIDKTDLMSVIYPIIDNAVILLQSKDVGKIRLCESSNCTWLFLDRSKNHSRRWCQMEICGNREKAKRHYNKQKQAH